MSAEIMLAAPPIRVGTARTAPLPTLRLRHRFDADRSAARFRRARRQGGRLLPGQDHQRADRRQCRRRLRFRGAAAGPIHAGAHPGQSAAGAAEHDRRRRHQDGELSLFDRAAGRHRDRHVPQHPGGGAGGRHRGRAIRCQQVLLARLDHHQPGDARGLAHGRACRRIEDARKQGGRGGGLQQGRHHLHVPAHAQRVPGHAVQDRVGLSGQRHHDDRHGARRGGRGHQFLGQLEVVQSGLGARRRRSRSWCRPSRNRRTSRTFPRCRSSPATTTTARSWR